MTSCRRVRRALPDHDGETSLPARVEVHLAHCLQCQAEAVRYRRLRRQLRRLDDRVFLAPATLAPAVAAGLGSEHHPSRRVAVFGAAATGAVVVAAGAVAIAGLRRSQAV